MQKKLHIKKGDTVMVITGESKGQKAVFWKLTEKRTGLLLKV